ncbi:RloB family protein [Streptomyces sp. AS02]|uniref:RloB family protein n=1 Tax=Streptomyces sp. AS02 TaxID=2938946 RepID=UPI0020218251|nr:RloB family protein [Streptomyces sp. AS02]MCL8013901.1 RloB family protein [Streptomyces sp. AS02]
MARTRGGDAINRRKGGGGTKGRAGRPRQVYVFTEGEVTEPEYIDIIMKNGVPAKAEETVQHHIANPNAESKLRKPIRLVQEAVRTLRKVEQEAREAGLKPDKDWNWPQVWVLFDRDDHLSIPEARRLARKEGVKVAYSHPCFELWRLLHYQNYTSSFGGVCGNASDLLRRRPGFPQTYGAKVRTVSEAQAKHVLPAQVLTPPEQDAPTARYATAKRYAERISQRRSTDNPDEWDPYTDVWRFVEDGLLLSGY